jgi:hypothetical protein
MTSSIVQFATRTAVRCLPRRPLLAQYKLIAGKKLARWSVIFLFTQLGLSGQQSKPKQKPQPPFTSAQSAPATLHGSFASLRMTGSHQDNTKNLGAQVVKLAFQSAKADAALVKTQQKAADTTQAGGATTQEPTVAVWPRLTSTAAKTFS